VGAPWCVVTDLGDRGQVQRIVDHLVPARIEPVPFAWPA
jgi:hypothetical protein